jgi:hypothetical protein
MPVMRDTAKVTVLDACNLEGTGTENMSRFADRTFDVVVGR